MLRTCTTHEVMLVSLNFLTPYITQQSMCEQRRLIQELRLLPKLDHPLVIKLGGYHVDPTNEVHRIIFHWYPFGSLPQFLTTGPHLSVRLSLVTAPLSLIIPNVPGLY